MALLDYLKSKTDCALNLQVGRGLGMTRILAPISAPMRVQSCVSYPSRMVLRLFGFLESVGADVDCFPHHLLRLAPQILRLIPNLI
jgi:hypothetical protein